MLAVALIALTGCGSGGYDSTAPAVRPSQTPDLVAHAGGGRPNSTAKPKRTPHAVMHGAPCDSVEIEYGPCGEELSLPAPSR